MATVPKKDVIILLPYIGLHSNFITKRLKSCIYRFYSFVNIKVIFQNTWRIKYFFPYKGRLNLSQQSKVIYRASCRDCTDLYIGKTKRRLHDRKTKHFKAAFRKAITLLLLLITLKQLVTTSNCTILTSRLPAKLTTIVRLRRPCLFRSSNHH